ncbi:MAG TPA: VWA domain-containing protein [Pyrinomonadaceae bacterium]|nr:VWA domain-containing protein [Pyrinomonadaceae bacterium]
MGQLVSGSTERTAGAPGVSGRSLAQARSPQFLQFVVLLLLVTSIVTSGLAQSGRNKESASKASTTKTRQGTASGEANRSSAPLPSPSQNPGTPSRPTGSTKNPVNDEIDESDTVRVISNLVPIPASVVDQKGIAVTGLKLEDFELRVDGQPRTISDMTRTETNVRLAMLFDNSGSLDFARDFEKQAARHFFRQVMRPADEAAIYSVESESYLAQPLTSDVSLLERTIDSFGKPEGSTSLFDAIIDASAYLHPFTGRRVLVIVSDGVETTSRADFETTMQRVLAADCQIFIVQTGLYDGANLRALAAERRMEQLSGQSGGAVYIPRTTSELNEAFQQIAADLAHQYVLSYYPGDERRDGRFHSIELRVRARKDVRVRARRGYYSPRASNVAANEW